MELGLHLKQDGVSIACETTVERLNENTLAITSVAPAFGVRLESTYVSREPNGTGAVHFESARGEHRTHVREHGYLSLADDKGRDHCLTDHLRFLRGIADAVAEAKVELVTDAPLHIARRVPHAQAAAHVALAS